jgi:type IV pilus assembly protein PilF
MLVKQLIPRFLLGAGIATCLVLSACVTTETKVFNTEASAEKEIEERVIAASNYLQEGNLDLAMKHLKRAHEVDPRSAKVNDLLAYVFWRNGEFELAEDHYKKMLSGGSGYSRGRYNYASFLYQQERYQEAMKQLEIIVADTLYDGRANAFASLGKSALKLGELAKAEEGFTRAATMDRTQAESRLELASLHFSRKNYVAAQRYYDQFRGLSGQSARSLWLGIRLARVFEDKDTEASFALALKNMYPKSQQYLDYKQSLGD